MTFKPTTELKQVTVIKGKPLRATITCPACTVSSFEIDVNDKEVKTKCPICDSLITVKGRDVTR